jgi:hypothetical protein
VEGNVGSIGGFVDLPANIPVPCRRDATVSRIPAGLNSRIAVGRRSLAFFAIVCDDLVMSYANVTRTRIAAIVESL